jgi:CHAT domain-containing protein
VAWTIWTASDKPPVAGAPDRAARLASLSRQYDEVDAAIRRADPRYAAALLPPTVGLAQIQRELLDSETVLIEFMLGADQSRVWVVTPQESRVMSLPARSQVDAAVRAFRQAVSTAADSPAAADAAGAALSRLLLAPLAPWLDRRRLLVVADGSLHGVPFGSLRRPGTSARLGDSDIVMLPSASMAALGRAVPPAGRPSPVLVVADPVFGAADPRVANGSRSSGTPDARRLNRLPFSRDEAAAISRTAGARPVSVAMDFEADRRLLLGREVERYRYIHVATHAIVDERRPPLSAIVLSLVNPDGDLQDGFLRLQDVYRLRLNADLVVLSACGTATGQPAAGEGLLSLARGALYAGARQVMVSLWDVDDAATAALMSEFYRHLFQAGAPPAAALRAAQAAVRRQPRFAHPYYWAGWIIQGADR